MSKLRRDFSKEFKLKVVSEVGSGMTVSEAARKYEITTGMIYRWRRELNIKTQLPVNRDL